MKNNSSLKMTLLKGRTFIVLALLIVFFSVASPNFLTTNTLLLLAKHVALYGILAIGMTYVIITGGIDLSVGAVVPLYIIRIEPSPFTLIIRQYISLFELSLPNFTQLLSTAPLK